MRCMPVRCTPNSTPMTYTPVRYKSPDFPHRGAVVDLSRSEFVKYEFFALVAKWSLLRSATGLMCSPSVWRPIGPKRSDASLAARPQHNNETHLHFLIQIICTKN